MATAGEQPQAGCRRGFGRRLAEDAPAGGNHRVGGEDMEGGIGRRRRLGEGKAFGIGAGQFVPPGRLVDLGGGDLVGHNPDLRQQGEAAQAGGGQFQAGTIRRYLKRNVMRPLLRS
jgi:hypothetical protein